MRDLNIHRRTLCAERSKIDFGAFSCRSQCSKYLNFVRNSKKNRFKQDKSQQADSISYFLIKSLEKMKILESWSEGNKTKKKTNRNFILIICLYKRQFDVVHQRNVTIMIHTFYELLYCYSKFSIILKKLRKYRIELKNVLSTCSYMEM